MVSGSLRIVASGRSTLKSKTEGLQFDLDREVKETTYTVNRSSGLPVRMKDTTELEVKVYQTHQGSRRLLGRTATRIHEEASFKFQREDPTRKLAVAPRVLDPNLARILEMDLELSKMPPWVKDGEEQADPLEALAFSRGGTRVVAQTYVSDVKKRMAVANWPVP